MDIQPGDRQQRIQQQILEQREKIGPRLTEVRGRLLRDIEEAQQAARRQASRLSRGTMRIIGIASGAFVFGFAAALMAGRIREQRRRRQRRDPVYWWGQARSQWNETRENLDEAREQLQDRLRELHIQKRVKDLQRDAQKITREFQREMAKQRR